MLRILVIATLAIGITVGVQSASNRGEAAAGACQNIIPNEPVLIFNTTGGTLAGPVNQQMTVYNSGLVTFSSITELGTPQIDARVANVSPAAVRSLLQDLQAAGASQNCDQSLSVADMPLKTITVLRGATDAFAHSFSYWAASNEYSAPDAKVRSFMQTHFPGS